MKPLKIAMLSYAPRSGGALMGVLNYLRSFSRICRDEEFFVICPSNCGYEQIVLPGASRYFTYTGSHAPLARGVIEPFRVPKLVAEYGPDVILAMANYGMRKPSAPQAVFVHQAYLFYPRKHYPEMPWKDRFRHKRLRSIVRETLPYTDMVLCQTPVVRDRYTAEYGYPSEKARVVRWATPTEITPGEYADVPAAIRDAGDAFQVLVMTPYQNHRNPGVLIPLCREYAKLFRRERVRFITTVNASDHPYAPRFLAGIAEHGLQDLVVNVGSLSRTEVPKYLAHANLLWLPTLIETFCLPYLEAMTIGTPILAPDLDFARYVCGDAAAYYDAWNYASMADKIVLLRNNATLRSQLVEKGKTELKRTDKFASNWDDSARDLIACLHELASRTSGN